MNNSSKHSPEKVLATDDPGDSTAERYRFQWTWAAVMCCAILDTTQDVEEVFCEHHEDVLIKHTCGSFTGQQVKTRQENQPPWKAADKGIIMSCARFAELESNFPSHFKRFIFLTNHTLHRAEASTSLPYNLYSVKSAESIEDLPGAVRKWVGKIAVQSSVAEVTVFEVLKKTEAKSELPKLRDAKIRLISAIIVCWPAASECVHSSIELAATALIEECSKASSLEHSQMLPSYLTATESDIKRDERMIAGKRMTCGRVKDILNAYKNPTAILASDPANNVDSLGEGTVELLRKKLEVGGFSAISSASAEDLRDKADYLRVQWMKKYGAQRGRERSEHISSLVLNDAGRSFEATQNDADSFGPAMREYLRGRFLDRRATGSDLLDSSDEHLEGFAYLLTARCLVAWSHARPWEV